MTEAPAARAAGGRVGDGDGRRRRHHLFFAVVILASEAAVRHYRPDLAAIAATGPRPLLLTAAADAGSGADYVLRVFGPNVGIDEDPATGSAQCVAGPYWSAVLGRPDWWPASSRPGGRCSTSVPTGDRVHIGGNAVTVFTGHLC